MTNEAKAVLNSLQIAFLWVALTALFFVDAHQEITIRAQRHEIQAVVKTHCGFLLKQ